MVNGMRTYPSTNGVVKVQRDSPFSIACSSAARPKAEAYFLKDGEIQQSGGRYDVTVADDGSQIELVRRRARTPDVGTYSCVFENPGGSTSSPVALDVVGELSDGSC